MYDAQLADIEIQGTKQAMKMTINEFGQRLFSKLGNKPTLKKCEADFIKNTSSR